jgi:NAD(P)-dependent dehydrogenase (short-subunit alcohol dehydrogenase family)
MTSAVQDKGAVIVTGASAAIAERLAHDGYSVIVTYATDAQGAEALVSAIDAKGGRSLSSCLPTALPPDHLKVSPAAVTAARGSGTGRGAGPGVKALLTWRAAALTCAQSRPIDGLQTTGFG